MFIEIQPDVYLYNDVVNVYVIRNENKAILVDFGSGSILDQLSEIGINTIDYILHTHYHRDQCYGDVLAIENGIKICAPHKERKLFVNAEDFWKSKSYYDIYYFKPTFFVSTQNIPLDLTFKHGDVFEWGPFHIHVIKTNGHTSESISYLIETSGKKLAFTGDLIHSGGKTITYYDLEYIYNDNGEGGIKRSFASFKRLLSQEPDLLLPSHGEIIRNPRKEINLLTRKFERARFAFCSEYSGIDIERAWLEEKGIKPVNLESTFPHIFHQGDCPPFIIIGKNRNCFMLDFVGDDEFGYTFQTLNEILNSYDVEKIDFILPTHHHDDHTAGISLLKQRYNTEVHALEEMVDILENPTHYRLNCLIDRQIKVDKILKDGETFEWDDYKFQIFHFPGQTEYHMGLFGTIDGKKIFFTGDTITERSLVDRDTNVNCLNFCRLGDDVGYMKCADILLNCCPEYLGISHYGIIKVDMELLQKFKLFVSEYEPVIADLVAQENPNMGFDPNWISFKPVRIITQPGEKVEVKLRARNYLNRISEIHYKLNLPNSWKAEPEKGTASIEPKTFDEIPIKIYVPSTEHKNGRTILTADIIWNNIRLGPFPDLMVDHGYIPSDSWTGWSHEKGGNLFIWIFNQIRSSKKFFK